jgi:hypothetical protein
MSNTVRNIHAIAMRVNQEAHKMAIKSVVYSDQSKTILTGSLDKTIKMWNPGSGVEPKTSAVDGEVQYMTVNNSLLLWAQNTMPEGVVPGDPVGLVKLCDMSSAAQLKCIVGPNLCLCISFFTMCTMNL